MNAAAYQLTLIGCEGIDEGLLQSSIALEAQAVIQEPESRPTQIEVRCRGTEASISVSDRVSGQRVTSKLDMSRTSRDARLRLLALGVTELMATLWSGAAPKSIPDAPSPPPTKSSKKEPSSDSVRSGAAPDAPPVDPGSQNQRKKRWSLSAGIRTSVLGSPTTWLFGGALSGDYRVAPVVWLGLNAALEYGRTDAGLAEVRWWFPSAAARVLLGSEQAWGSWGLGGGVRAGALHWSPKPAADASEAMSQTHYWWGPMLAARVRLGIAGAWFLDVVPEIGFVASGFEGVAEGQGSSRQRLLEFSKGWAAVSVELGW